MDKGCINFYKKCRFIEMKNCMIQENKKRVIDWHRKRKIRALEGE